MDKQFYEDYFQPIFLQLIVLNYTQMTKKELDPERKKFYDINKHIFPMIDRFCRKPNVSIEEVVNDKIVTEKVVEKVTENKTINEVQTGTVVTITKPEDDDIPIDKESNYDPSDDEDKKILIALDDRADKILQSIRKTKWITITNENDSDSDIDTDDVDSDYEGDCNSDATNEYETNSEETEIDVTDVIKSVINKQEFNLTTSSIL
jgi:hypothetical protein